MAAQDSRRSRPRWRHGHKRWRIGRLTFGFGWDVDGLTRPQFYRYPDQPEAFGFRFAPETLDDAFSIDFEWVHRNG